MTMWLQIALFIVLIGASFIIVSGIVFGLFLAFRWLGVIRDCYTLSSFDKDRLKVRLKDAEVELKWNQMKAVYPAWFTTRRTKERRFFALEQTSGMAFTLCIQQANVGQLLGELYDAWSANLADRRAKVEGINFSHAHKWLETKWISQRIGPVMVILFALSLTLIFAAKGLFREQYIARLWPVYVALFSIVALLFVGLSIYSIFVSRRHAGIVSLGVTGDRLFWTDEYGRFNDRRIGDVRCFSLRKTEGELKFSDGRKLRDLDKLRYWPVLREYLLSKLEPSEKMTHL